jgi:hypothetical protein
MMFEVADLAVASPATVSRCGMVYLEPSILGIKPFVECWIRKLPDSVFAFRDKLNKLFDAFLEVLNVLKSHKTLFISTNNKFLLSHHYIS